jgi:hypothetical protein
LRCKITGAPHSHLSHQKGYIPVGVDTTCNFLFSIYNYNCNNAFSDRGTIALGLQGSDGSTFLTRIIGMIPILPLYHGSNLMNLGTSSEAKKG